MTSPHGPAEAVVAAAIPSSAVVVPMIAVFNGPKIALALLRPYIAVLAMADSLPKA